MIQLSSVIKNILTSDILTCDGEDELGSVLVKKELRHEPIFVFEQKKFLGLISPYHTLFRNSYAYATKAKNCLVIPPHITVDTTVHDVAHHMVDLKLYSLPVFDESNTISAVVTANAILRQIASSPKLMKEVSEALIIQKPITSSIHATILNVYAIMKDRRVGRVILVDNDQKVKGILARRDLQNVFLKNTLKAGYQTRQRTKSRPTLDETLFSITNNSALKFAETKVVTALHDEPILSLLKKIIRLGLPSVVIIDKAIPVGFVSRHDILVAFVSLQPSHTVPIIWENSITNFKELPMVHFYSDVDAFITKISKHTLLHDIEIHISRPSKEAYTNKPNYHIKLHLHLQTGKTYILRGQDAHIQTALKKAINTISSKTKLSDKQMHQKRRV